MNHPAVYQGRALKWGSIPVVTIREGFDEKSVAAPRPLHRHSYKGVK